MYGANYDPMTFRPNTVTHGGGFYISYNWADRSIYGDVTTALVIGQMEKFYILLGDHRKQYDPLIPQGLDACLAYYREHLSQSSNYSDKLPEGV